MKSEKFRESFVFVAGSTPQIITETVFALSQRKPPVYPDEMHVVTTATGRKKIEETLIKGGVLDRLRTEYQLPSLELDPSNILVVKEASGRDLEDIRTPEDNEALGNLITDLVRRLAADQSARLHCSIAGGRKTMSFYLGAALQLFGRPWDRLYHVLVTPEFESNPDFFYKPRENTVIECRMPGGTVSVLNTDDAEVVLAELPFVRLGGTLNLRGRSFRELVTEGQKDIDVARVQPEVCVNLSERALHVGTDLVELVPMQLTVYTMLLRQKVRHCKYPDRPYCLECTGCYLSVAEMTTRQALEEMAKDYEMLYGERPLVKEELLSKHPEGLEAQLIRQNFTKINNAVKEQLSDPTLLPYYVVANDKKYAGSRYGVRVEKGKIRIE